MYRLVKVVIRDQPGCKTAAKSGSEVTFGNVTIQNRDAKGKKKKEVIANAARVRIDQLQEGCKICMKTVAEIAMQEIEVLDKAKKFEGCRAKEKERHYEHHCHGHFKYKPTYYDAIQPKY